MNCATQFTLSWPNKDPDEILDYKIVWTDLLAGDIITASEWIVPAGLVKNQDNFDDTETNIWLSAGVPYETYNITNRVTTDGGRVFDRTVTLTVMEK